MSFWSSLTDLISGRNPVGDMIGSAIRGYRRVRVAVTGSRASGKTVFLTSLANHLRDHNPDTFPMDGMSVHWDKDAITGDTFNSLPVFDYNEARGSLARGEWPKKTAAASILPLRLLVRHADGSHEKVQLELVDIPGERIADFAMKDRSYAEWCRWMEREHSSPSYREYLDKVAAAGPESTAAMLDAYRDFLASEYESLSACITPSTVKLGLDGSSRGGSPADFRRAIAGVPVGLKDDGGRAHEFIPLPQSCLDGDPGWRKTASAFAKSYDRYVRKVVRPVVEWLADAEKMLYLVDVLTLLQSGAVACDSERRHGEAAMAALCPRADNMLDRLLNWTAGLLWKTRINAVYVAATKSDLVFSNENRDKMASLAERLLGRPLAFLGECGVKTGVVSCAAVCSTREVLAGGRNALQGKIDGADVWVPSDVPGGFPGSSEEWDRMREEGRFNYQFAFPWFETAQMCPPRQMGLNLLAKKMLER